MISQTYFTLVMYDDDDDDVDNDNLLLASCVVMINFVILTDM